YYKEIGYDEALAERKKRQGAWSIIRYWKPFEAYAVERLLTEHTNCVIDFGAGHSVYEELALLQRVQRALAAYLYVVLLLPSPDPDESLRILHERNRMLPKDIRKTNEHFVRHPSNGILAKFTVYTKSKTPEETCAEILRLVA
ncbi:MAG: shikimate kinase, partial [Cyanobacteria bacterium P01_A01_bin.135]